MPPLTFIYPLLHFLQPGVLWPDLAQLRPMQVLGVLAVLASLRTRVDVPRSAPFKHSSFRWFLAFILVQAISVWRGGFGSMLSELLDWIHIPEYVIISLIIIRHQRSLEQYIKGSLVGCAWIIGYGIYAFHNGLRVKFGSLAGAYGMYENHNDYTFIIIQSLPFFYFMRNRGGWLWRLLMTTAGLAAMYGVVLSSSRGGMIALVFECCLLIIYGTTRRARRFLLPLALVVGIAGVGYQYQRRAMTSTTYTSADAESSRYELWKAAHNMLKDNPILGVGSRRFAEYSKVYYDLSHDQLGKNSHNTFIEVAACTGLVGVLCFGMMLYKTHTAFRISSTLPGSLDSIDAISAAGRVSLFSILLRSLWDAKVYDWSLYFLLTISIVVAQLRALKRRRSPVPL